MSSFELLSYDDANQNQHATYICENSRTLTEPDGSGNHRDDGAQIEIVAGTHGTDALDGDAPNEIRRQRANQTQVEQIAPHGRLP